MAFLLAALGAVVAIPLGISWAGRARWGARLVRASGGDGAYREGGALRQEPRSVPSAVRWASIVAWLWGITTLLVLVPAGALLSFMVLRAQELVTLLAFPFLAAVISGAVLAVRLLGAGTGLPLRHEASVVRARRVAEHARWHHGAVWALFALASLGAGPEALVIAGAILAIPCGFGFVVASAIDRAARAVEAIDAADEVPLADAGDEG